MSDELMEWTPEEKAEAFDLICKALCTCGAAGPCTICDTIWWGGALHEPVLEKFKDQERAIQNLSNLLYRQLAQKPRGR